MPARAATEATRPVAPVVAWAGAVIVGATGLVGLTVTLAVAVALLVPAEFTSRQVSARVPTAPAV